VKAFSLACAIVLICTSCTSSQTTLPLATDVTPQRIAEPASEACSRGQNAINLGYYTTAREQFTTLIENSPIDERISHALLGSGYAHYRVGDIDSSIAISSTFIESHKNHSLLDYAFYLNGLARYSAGIEQLQKHELVSNNHNSLAREAFESFLHVVRHYPNSRYLDDSRIRMETLFNNLAEHKLALAKKAVEQNNDHDAIARAEYITKHYLRTHAAQEAYIIMINALETQDKLTKASALHKLLAQIYPDYPLPDNERDS